MKEQKEVEENHIAQPPPWLINNVHFCYDVDYPANNHNEKNIKIPKKHTQMDQKTWKRRQALQHYSQIEEVSIHTFEMTVLKVALNEIHKIEGERWVTYRHTLSSMQSMEYNKEIIQY